jgi:hypothetical protein
LRGHVGSAIDGWVPLVAQRPDDSSLLFRLLTEEAVRRSVDVLVSVLCVVKIIMRKEVNRAALDAPAFAALVSVTKFAATARCAPALARTRGDTAFVVAAVAACGAPRGVVFADASVSAVPQHE